MGWLSGAVAKRTEAEDVFANTTIDQIIARKIGQETPLPSLEVATEDFTGYVGACSPGSAASTRFIQPSGVVFTPGVPLSI